MKQIFDGIEKVVDVACLTFMSIGFIITFFHIIGRYILRAPIYYSEELARYCFVWSCMLGASVVNRNDEHTNVTFFTMLLPKRAQALLYIGRELAILVLLAFFIFYGVDLSVKMRTIYTPALDVSWFFLYMSLPVASLLLVISTVRLIAAKARELKAI